MERSRGIKMQWLNSVKRFMSKFALHGNKKSDLTEKEKLNNTSPGQSRRENTRNGKENKCKDESPVNVTYFTVNREFKKDSN